MSYDTFVGFREIPQGIEAILAREGYKELAESPDKDKVKSYEHDALGQPVLFYDPSTPKSEDNKVPDWRKAPATIVADVNINYNARYGDAAEEAERIARVLVRHFNAIFYDPTLDQFETKEDLG